MKSILIVSDYFYPAFRAGGPVRSITNLLHHIDGKYDCDVLTSDRDLGGTESMSGISADSWCRYADKARVFYKSAGYSLFTGHKALFADKMYDILYLNSFFSFNSTIKILILSLLGGISCKQIILAPRGELTDGAMQFSRLKKRFYLLFFKLFLHKKKIIFQFTASQEMQESLKYLGKVRYKIVPNMHDKIPAYHRKEKSPACLQVLFLSRISAKKNLLTACKALREITAVNIKFTVAGPVDDMDYWLKCQAVLDSLPDNIKVCVAGEIGRNNVAQLLHENHVFFLPTFNENYGHAIVEALVNSTLVMISDKTPWSEVREHGGYVGGCADQAYYSRALIELGRMEEAEYNRRTLASFAYCNKILLSNEKEIFNLFEN